MIRNNLYLISTNVYLALPRTKYCELILQGQNMDTEMKKVHKIKFQHMYRELMEMHGKNVSS